MNVRNTERHLRRAGQAGRCSAWLSLFSGPFGPNTTTGSGLTPLQTTLEAGHLHVADWLVRNGATVPKSLQEWMAPLLFNLPRRPAFSWLLKQGMAVYPEASGPTPLLKTLLEKGTPVFQWLMEQGTPVDPHHELVPSLLHEAVRRGVHDPWVPFLLAAGADPNRLVASERGKPDPPMLHLALGFSRPTAHALLDDLLKAGADPDAPDRQGRTLWQAWGQLWPDDPTRAQFHERFRLEALVRIPEPSGNARRVRL